MAAAMSCKHFLATTIPITPIRLMASARGDGLGSLFGFGGEPLDPVTGCYLLGNGYRAYDPVLMRFHRPDSWSPF